MSYYDATLAGDLRVRFDALVRGWPDVERKTMFGCPAYRASDETFAVLVSEGVVLTRLPDPERDRLNADFGTEPFYAGGRYVPEWAKIPRERASLEELEPFVRASYEAAMGG